MRAAVVDDVHLRASDIGVGGPVFLAACQSAQDHKCDALIIGGDLFDSTLIGGRGASTGTVVSWAKRGLAAFDGIIYILLGNHELPGVGQAHALEVLRGLPNVEIIDKDCVVDVCGAKIAFLPYISPAHFFSHHPEWTPDERRERFAQALVSILEALKAQKPDIFVGHCAITGAVANKSGFRIFGSGNTMELMADQVLSVAPKVAWGDFHRRQSFSPNRPNDGYVGALRQLNFGEEGNPTGYRIIGTDTGEDEFIEIASQQYFNVEAQEYGEQAERFIALAAAGAIVKVRGSEFPSTGFFEELPAGIRFERTAPDELIQRRSDESFAPDESTAALLAKWHRHAVPDVSIEQLTEAFGQVAEHAVAEPSGIGSLSRVVRVKLRNIAKHTETEVFLEGLKGVICIDGDNGAGKTTLVESLMLAIYGESPSYGQDVYGMVTHGFFGDALIEVEVEADSGTFVFQRSIHVTAKTKSQEYTVLQREKDGSLQPVAGGPKRQAEGELFASTLIGDKALIMASVFAAQKAKDLIDYTPAERKDLLSSLLGSEKYVAIADAAKGRASEISKVVAERSAGIRAITDRLEPIAPLAVRATELGAELEQARHMKKTTAAEREELLEEKARVSANSEHTIVRQRIGILEDEASRLTRQMSVMREKMEARERDLQQLMKEALEADDPKRVQVLLDDARADIRDAESARQNAQARRDEAQREIDNLQEEVRAAERAFHAAHTEWRNKLVASQANLDKKVQELRYMCDKVTDEYDAAKDRAALLVSDDIGCKGNLECVFLKDAKRAAASLEGFESHRDEIMQDLDYKDEWPESEAVRKIEADEPRAADTAQMDERIKDLRASMPALPTVNRTEVEKLERRLDAANASRNARAERKGKLDAGASIKGDYDELAKAQMAKQKELTGLKQKLQGLSDPAAAIAEITAKIQNLDVRLAKHTADQDRLVAEVASLETRIKHSQEARERAQEMQAEVDYLKANANVYMVLNRAFGRDGIPQLILDSAIPRLAELSSSLLAAAEYDGKLLFRTQGVTNSGKAREVLDILAWDGETGDFRDVSRFSGGEGSVLRLAIRLAFGLLQAERAGKRIRVFVADESFAALKPHRALAALAMFEALKTRFQQVFVISHQNEVTAAISQTVFVHKDNGVSKVEVLHG